MAGESGDVRMLLDALGVESLAELKAIVKSFDDETRFAPFTDGEVILLRFGLGLAALVDASLMVERLIREMGERPAGYDPGRWLGIIETLRERRAEGIGQMLRASALAEGDL